MNNDIIITEEFEGLIKQARDAYVIVGGIISDGYLDIALNGTLTVVGDILVKYNMRTSCTIISTGKISAGGHIIIIDGGIRALDGISAGANISSKSYIISGKSLDAGQDIGANRIDVVDNISSYGALTAFHTIRVGGFISVYKSVSSLENIIAGESIMCGDFIRCKSIISGASIGSTSYIDVKTSIFAGLNANLPEGNNIITCTELRNGKIVHGKLELK